MVGLQGERSEELGWGLSKTFVGLSDLLSSCLVDQVGC